MESQARILEPSEKYLLEIEKGQIGAIIDLLEKLKKFMSQDHTNEIVAQKLLISFNFSRETLIWMIKRIDTEAERTMIWNLFSDPTKLFQANMMLLDNFFRVLLEQINEFIENGKSVTALKTPESLDEVFYFQSQISIFLQTFTNSIILMFNCTMPPIPLIIDSKGEKVDLGNNPMLSIQQLRTTIEEIGRIAVATQENLRQSVRVIKDRSTATLNRETEQQRTANEEQRHRNELSAIRVEKRWTVMINILTIILTIFLTIGAIFWTKPIEVFQLNKKLQMDIDFMEKMHNDFVEKNRQTEQKYYELQHKNGLLEDENKALKSKIKDRP